GIPQDAQARIFDSFTQADPSVTRRFGGSGLGTTIAKQLIETLGGQIGLHSREGEGSTFWFELPFALQTPPASADPQHFESPLRVAILASHELSPRMQAMVREWGAEPVPVENLLQWEPRARGADRRLLMQFADQNGERVEVFLALYASQNDRADASGFGEGALPPDTDWRWLAPAPAPAGMTGDALFAQGAIKRVAYTQWRSGDHSTASSLALKLAVMRDRTLMRARPVATLIVSAEGDDTDAIAARLARFTAAMGDRDAWMDRAAGLR
ncbi:MAG: EpsI family protein, partial [Erythrobacter sp. 34-65-8]